MEGKYSVVSSPFSQLSVIGTGLVSLDSLTLYTLTSFCIHLYTLNCSLYISYGDDKVNLSNNLESLYIVIISLILVIF